MLSWGEKSQSFQYEALNLNEADGSTDDTILLEVSAWYCVNIPIRI